MNPERGDVNNNIADGAQKAKKSSTRQRLTESNEETAEPLAPSMGRVAGEEALRYSNDFEARSRLHHASSRKRHITQLRWSDLEIGKLLGEGNFSHVYEVRLNSYHDLPPSDESLAERTIEMDVWRTIRDFKTPDDDVDIWDMVSVASISSSEDDGVSEAKSQAQSVQPSGRQGPSTRTYALKHLHPQVTTKQKNFTASAIDLVLEAKILSCLEHPNIVKLYGVTEGAISKVFSGDGFFLLLDRLHETLEDRIREWIAVDVRALTVIASASIQKQQSSRRVSSKEEEAAALAEKERTKHLSERIGNVAIDIARGMEYLHKHRIVFRDLKPSNVGFTKANKVKIFDFGLAREIVDDTKRLTGNTGSLRYMAPEVNRRQFYGLPVDVYSFGILLWELTALHKPFKGMSVEQHKELVIEKGFRPKISVVPGSESLKKLIKTCWSTAAEIRPTFSDVRLALADEVESHRRQQELEEIERQSRIAPKTAKLRMRMMRQRRSTRVSRYSKSGTEGTFESVPFS